MDFHRHLLGCLLLWLASTLLGCPSSGATGEPDVQEPDTAEPAADAGAPETPTPETPTPETPTPETPTLETPTPETPTPETPTPETPTPETPTPETPTPETPTPETPTPETPTPETPTPEAEPMFGETGPFPVVEATASVTTADCTLEAQVRKPAEGGPVVVLAHGFARNPDDMDGWARHLASWGFVVVNAPFCTFSNHENNGLAYAVLGAQEASANQQPGAFYVGFSAGGLAAMVAAATDGNALGFFGLDAVNNQAVGATYAAQLTAPAAGLMGDGSSCNSQNNFNDVWESLESSETLRVPGASHFDFEATACGAFDLACGFCAPTSPETHALIQEVTTSWLVDVAGLSPGASLFSAESDRGEELRGTGALAPR